MKGFFNNICLVMSIMFCFLYTMMDSMAFFTGGLLFALPGIIGLLTSGGNELKSFAIVVFISSLFNFFVTSYGIGGSIVFLVTCGVTFLCLRNLKIFFSVSLLICLWLVAFLYYQMFVNGTVNGDIFLDYGLSKNYPGSMLVIFNCLWAVWKYLYYHRMPLILPILSTIMAFFLDGRSSLICMVIITIFCFVFRGKKLAILMVILFVAALSYFWSSLEGFFELTSLASRGLETTRTEIWQSYFTHLDIPSIIFGLDTPHLPVLNNVNGNPHNSFLSFHRRMGLIGVVFLFYYIIKEFRVLSKRKLFVPLFLNMVLIVRMLFDGMLTTGQDFFIFTLLFMPLCYNNEEFQIKKQLERKGETGFEKIWDKLVVLL